MQRKNEPSNHIRLLSEVSSNEEVEIVSIDGDGPVQTRVMEMGCLPGTHIQLINRQAFRGSVIAQLRDMKIAIRHSDAKRIKVC